MQINIAFFVMFCLGLIGLLWAGWRQLDRSTRALRDREEQLRSLINAAPDVICLKDSEGRWLEANKGYLELFAFSDLDYQGKAGAVLIDLADPVYRDAMFTCQANDEKTWYAGKTMRFEEKIISPDGQEKIYDVIKKPIFNKDGTRKGLLVLGRDNSGWKKHEAELQMLKAAVEQTVEGIVISDHGGTILYVNPAFEQITGYDLTGIIGENFSILKSDQHDDRFYAEIWNNINQGKVWQGRILNRKRNGELFTEEMTISPIRDKFGQIINFVSITQDISEQLQLERENALLEEQFHHAQKTESVGRLAGGVAHDFNNILTPILAYSDMALRDDTLSKQYRDVFLQIIEAGKRARDIVQQLLMFSRKQMVQVEPMNLNRVLCCFEELLRRTIRENITMELLLDPRQPVVMADKGRLEQVIMNLVINAQDAMPDGGMLLIETRKITVNITRDNFQGIAPGDYLLLEISDTGVGMDKNTVDSVFEPFFTTKEKEKGTGLGMATVFGIIKQFGGEIRVYSVVGEGTRFAIYLPVVEKAEVAGISEEVVPVSKSYSVSAGRFERLILNVEDDRQVRELTCHVLKNAGYSVICAENGQKALELVNNQDRVIDLLVTDVIMPGINGKELFERLSVIYPNMRVIYLSGYGEEILTDEDTLKEDVTFIQKPFSVEKLTVAVEKVLGGEG